MKLKIGDIITRDRETRMVLEVFTQTVITNYEDNQTQAAGPYTEQELLDSNWVFPVRKWMPEIDEEYWFTDACGKVVKTLYCKSSTYDEKLTKIGNFYQTEEEAEEALKRVLAAYKG